ncbi:hypothetical protein TPA0907_55640 [Micromonospora humidisoli]|uniref:hypothetical protein n=1 Tax=Micromonospora sp. AKA109 TaxID=2733865 RepID=UPI0022C3FE63|nr:hypothetical protein [Micromonospora sp. AKA109]GHJ11197.1 hypothetical protein TPA0907_55640 [Micromonospora sp. AKA109]
MTRRRLLAALAAALVAGVAATLALAAAADAWTHDGAAVLAAVAAAWLTQPIPHLLRRRTR